MSVDKKEFKILSSDKVHMLSGLAFCPEGEAKGFFHVVHGMTEHIARYESFMRDMAERGYICFGYDNLGHGRTANDDSELGYIADRDGWELLAKDVRICSETVMTEYGKNGKRLPYCLMGHSMGSFIVRLAAEKYVRPDKLIIMGTGGANGAAGIGLALIEMIKILRGDRYISPLVNKLAFGNYNKRFEDDGAPDPWLTTDKNIRIKYSNDKYCTFKFSVSAMGDLIRLMKYSNSAEWYKKLDKGIPILLVSGEDDPVGNYGKGIREVYDKLKKQNANVKCILYKGARHEILNDFTYEKVKEDIIEFCS